MIYLKKYKNFLESDEFDITDNDKEDVKMAKEKLNSLKVKLNEYNSKKSQVDSLYKSDNIKPGDLEKIVGKDDNRNEFLVSYANIAAMTKKIEDLKEKDNKKAAELSEFKDRLSDAGEESKESISDRISVIGDQIKDIKSKISESSKKLPEMIKEHELKMSNLEENMKKWIEKIQ